MILSRETTHNYTLRYPGHDYTFTPSDGGQRGRMTGWGLGLQRGDYLLLDNDGAPTRYRIDSVRYFSDPRDMWSADVTFAPREPS